MPAVPPSQDAALNPLPASAPSLGEFYAAESQRIRQTFETTGEGVAALLARSDLVDAIARQLYGRQLCSQPEGPEQFCLLALGGYGRRELFPHADVDLLFLTGNGSLAPAQRESLRAFLGALWDLGLRVGHSTHTLADCGRLHRDNLEFNVALLDARYLAGDPGLFARLREEVIPHLVARDHPDLLRNLGELTRLRHAKHGNTIFHLEPNLKETPGGLRDYHVCRWVTQITELDRCGVWVTPEEVWAARAGLESRQAFEFLASTRCFLHYLQGRDANQLSYEGQDQAAAWGVGRARGPALPPALWTRNYFLQARCIDRLTRRLLDEALPARSSLYGLYKDWRSRFSNADFAVVRGRIFARQPSALEAEPDLLPRLFEMVGRHGLELSPEAERSVEDAVKRLGEQAPHLPALWTSFKRVLLQPFTALALREMHRLGLLTALFPEFQAIDSLVIRDYYHRYTVDEHSLMAVEHLQALREAGREIPDPSGAAPMTEPQYAEIFSELEHRELLLFAVLLHDLGKGLPETDHIQGSLKAVDAIMARLDFAAAERETVRFLVRNHLEMSAAFQRRDVFDPETVRAFASKVQTPELLKMLCLLTYADIKAVNPEALRPWKAELLWQLYAATSNFLARSLDEERVQPDEPEREKLREILPTLSAPATLEDIQNFLEGFPRRYLAIHSAQEVAAHFELARRLPAGPVQVELRRRDALFELCVVTPDRPLLFASLTGVLTAWGMNIVKAEAFANRAGTVLDTFRFVDLHKTLDLNPSERDRLKATIVEVLSGRQELEKLVKGRIDQRARPRTKVRVSPQLRFDDASSSHSTLLELVAQDRPGLLYQISATLASLGCNIEIALIDTEGQKALDVIYLTFRGTKLDPRKEQELRAALAPLL